MGYFERFSKGEYQGKTTPKKIWHFIWHEDSIESWLVNIILAFVFIKYLIYPGLGFLLATSHPIVAVVSGSMEHPSSFDTFWETSGKWYEERGISKEEFSAFPMHNGFNKGDIMILYGSKPESVNLGDVIVFIGARSNPRPDPIIHRVIKKDETETLTFHTKGDNNPLPIDGCYGYGCLYESDISSEQIIGKAFIRVPYLGYIKIWAVEAACVFGDFNFCIKR
jgi:signal peptidase I